MSNNSVRMHQTAEIIVAALSVLEDPCAHPRDTQAACYLLRILEGELRDARLAHEKRFRV